MDLGKEQIIKALECCKSPKLTKCNGCPREEEDSLCMYRLNEDVLALIKSQEKRIKELTEENERLERICESYALQYGTVVDKEVFLKRERANTVRKMQLAIQNSCIEGGIFPVFVKSVIDKVANELIEGGG